MDAAAGLSWGACVPLPVPLPDSRLPDHRQRVRRVSGPRIDMLYGNGGSGNGSGTGSGTGSGMSGSGSDSGSGGALAAVASSTQSTDHLHTDSDDDSGGEEVERDEGEEGEAAGLRGREALLALLPAGSYHVDV